MAFSDNSLFREGLREIRRRLPSGWRISEVQTAKHRGGIFVTLTAPDRRAGPVAIEARSRLDPKGTLSIIDSLKLGGKRGPLVVLSPYLSEATRQRLREGNIGYLDLTGNAWIVVAKPGLYIETRGVDKDPNREKRAARSLRGPKAGRIVRALVDRKKPPGIRELAAITNIDPGYVSRVLYFLDSEALVTRVGRGRIQSVDWPALLRRWAQDAPLELRGRARTYLEPRGLASLVERLAKFEDRYAITCSLAAEQFVPSAPARLATIWVGDADPAATSLGLRPAEAGANVIVIEPNDEDVFKGAIQRNEIWYVAPSQIAVDLLTSPGRGPAEGEQMIDWMRANEDAWRL